MQDSGDAISAGGTRHWRDLRRGCLRWHAKAAEVFFKLKHKRGQKQRALPQAAADMVHA